MSAGISQEESRVGVGSAGGIDLWQELPKLAVMVMELSWLVPWFQLITLAVKDQSAWFIGLIFILVLLLSYVLARAAFRLNIKDTIRKRVFLGYILVAVILSLWAILYREAQPTDLWSLYNQSLDSMSDFRELIPPEVMVFGAVLFLVRRGFSLARDWGGANSVINSIQSSIVFYFLLGIMARSTIEDIIEVNLFIFLVAAIFGMLTARIGSIRRLRGGRGVEFSFRWLGSILTSTILITGLTAAVAVFSASQIERLNQSLRLIFYTVLYFIATPFVALVSRVFPALESLRQVWPTIDVEQEATDWQLGAPENTHGDIVEDTGTSGIELLLQLRFILYAIILLAGIILIIRMTQRWRGGGEAGVDDDRTALLDGRGLFRWMLDAIRFRAKKTADSLVQAARLNRRERIKAAARIRRIYAEFMELCENLELARAESQTPLEFLPLALRIFPQTSKELELITDSYQRVRYGELPETHQEVLEVEQAWKQVRELGDLLKKQVDNSK
jgi:hypothetical protein